MKRLDAFNEERAGRGEGAVRLGMGIHTGDLRLGIIGEVERIEATVIADAVNIASRLEGLTKRYHCSILISGTTRDALDEPGRYRHRFVEKVQVKGRVEGIEVFELFESDPAELAVVKNATRAEFERGLAVFGQGEFEAAEIAFRNVLEQFDDVVAHLHLQRIEIMRARGSLPDDWDGTFRMEVK